MNPTQLDLARTLAETRAAEVTAARRTASRAGPSIRTALGRGLIRLGDRIAGGELTARPSTPAPC